jgi:hypothetical protein
MALKPVTFKIEEREIEALEREARQSNPPKMRSEYVRDIVMKRHEPKLPKPQRSVE